MNVTPSAGQNRDIDHHIDRIFSTLESNKERTTVGNDASPPRSNTDIDTNHIANAPFLDAYLNIAHEEYEADEEDESTGE